jgi:uncharacterized protein YbjT (DUF2867 family)
MQGFLGFREPIIAQGKFFAAAVLTAPGHEGRIYDLTGPEALTHSAMAERFSDALGRRVEFVDVSPEAMRGALIGVGIPLWQVEGLLEDYAHYRRNEASVVTSTVHDVTGTAARTFADFLRNYAPAFSK